MKPELRVGYGNCFVFTWGRKAKVHVLMPLGDAERDALVEVIFGGPFRGGVHDADQFVAVAVLFI